MCVEEWRTQEFQTEEEAEKALDELAASAGEVIMEEDGKTSLLDPLRMEQMKFCHSILAFLTKDKPVKLTYRLHESFQSMGSISLEGERIAFEGAKWILRVAEFANNMDVYPLAKNAVRITFTFLGLTRPIE